MRKSHAAGEESVQLPVFLPDDHSVHDDRLDSVFAIAGLPKNDLVQQVHQQLA